MRQLIEHVHLRPATRRFPDIKGLLPPAIIIREITHMSARLLAGVSVPDSPLITDSLEFAQKLSEPYLFNHALRSWLFAVKIGHLKGIDYDAEVVGESQC